MTESAPTPRTAIEQLPHWRRSFRAESPDGRFVAEVNPAWEIAMGGPRHGILCLSAGLHLPHCSPVFVWSQDSRYLAVPQFIASFWRGRRQQLLVIDVAERWIYRSVETARLFSPESFVDGRLTAIRNPHRRPTETAWQIPADAPARFKREKQLWAFEPG